MTTTFNTNDKDTEYRDYVLVMSKTSGSMRITYFMVDPHSNKLLPKPCVVKWPRMTDLIEYRVCVLKNTLYVIGGREKSTGKAMRAVLKYDPALGRWRECASLKKPRLNFTATAFNNRIYVIGGESPTGELLDTCESYEPLTDDWHREEKLLAPRKHHACVATNDVIYLCGGASKAEPYSDHIWIMRKCTPDKRYPEKQIYDWFAFKDPTQKTLSRRLAKHNVLVANHKLFFIGGMTKAPQDIDASQRRKSKKDSIMTSNAIEAYRLVPKITKEVVLPTQSTDLRQKMTTWNTDPQHKRQRKHRAQVLVVDHKPKEHTQWIKDLPPQPSPPGARLCAGTVLIGKRIYCIGGHSAEDPAATVKTVQYFDLKRRQWFSIFPLDDSTSYTDVECVKLTVPLSNKDFTPVKYGDCKWVMW